MSMMQRVLTASKDQGRGPELWPASSQTVPAQDLGGKERQKAEEEKSRLFLLPCPVMVPRA